MKFSVVIEEDLEDGGYVAQCPAIKGCWSQGDTIEEALLNIEEAIRGCLNICDDMVFDLVEDPLMAMSGILKADREKVIAVMQELKEEERREEADRDASFNICEPTIK